jgi:hypothetical protein
MNRGSTTNPTSTDVADSLMMDFTTLGEVALAEAHQSSIAGLPVHEVTVRQSEWLAWRVLKRDARLEHTILAEELTALQNDVSRSASASRTWLRHFKYSSDEIHARRLYGGDEGLRHRATESFVEQVLANVRYFAGFEAIQARAA